MKRSVLVFLLLLVLAPAAAFAAGASRSWGPELGLSSDPSQVVFGAHLSFGSRGSNLDFVPGIDVGVGDNVTVTALNGDFHWRFDTRSSWRPYVGAGVSLYDISGRHDVFGNDNTVGGGNLIVGTVVPTNGSDRFSVEGRFALGDGPSFRLIGAWNFAMR